MWIIPKNLHTSRYVADMKGLGVDCEQFSQLSENSLMWRSKPTASPTWSKRWKRVSWIQHLSSLILKPSHSESFVERWTSSLGDSPVSLSQMRERVAELKTQDICSLTSETESESANLELFSSKMLKELSQQKHPRENRFSTMSSENWKDWVTMQRQEYSQRVKLAHLTKEKGSSSWATPNTMDTLPPRSYEAAMRQATTSRKGRTDPSNLREQVDEVSVQAYKDSMKLYLKVRRAADSIRAEEAKNFPTPRTSDAEGGRIETVIEDGVFKSKRHKSNQTFGAKLRDAVETYEEKKWPTPRARDYKGGHRPESMIRKDGKSRMDALPQVVEYDPSSRPITDSPVDPESVNKNGKHLESQGLSKAELQRSSGKLNPDWVEQLMGLTIESTDLGSWGTELSHK